MARDPGLDRGRGGLEVTDLAHQHDVRVLAQDRSQRLGEGEPLGLAHLDLRDACDLILDRILDRDDVHPSGLELVERRVERRRLAASRRAGDQHHALAVAEQPLEHLALLGRQAQVGDRAAQVGLVQDADDDLLAAPGHRDGRHAEVHRLAVHPGGGVAVVRVERIGDVEPGPDLHPAHQGRAGSFRQPHHLAQHAVHPVAHHHGALGGLGVDIAGALAHRVADHRVHQLGDGGLQLVLAGVGHRLEIQGLHPRRLETAQQALDRPLRPVQLVDPLHQRGRGGDLKGHVPPAHEAERLLHVEVARVRGGDLDGPVVGGERQDLVLPGEALRQQRNGARLGRGEVDDRQPESLGHRLDDLGVRRPAGGYDRGPDLRHVRRQLLEQGRRDDPAGHQHRSEPGVRRPRPSGARFPLRISRHIGTMRANLTLYTLYGGAGRLCRAAMHSKNSCVPHRWR